MATSITLFHLIHQNYLKYFNITKIYIKNVVICFGPTGSSSANTLLKMKYTAVCGSVDG
jgi:hypothetical protein